MCSHYLPCFIHQTNTAILFCYYLCVRITREFTTKEIVMHNSFFNVDSLFLPTLSTKAGEYASIDTLTESFVNNLQTNFPSTVSTVFRLVKFIKSNLKPILKKTCDTLVITLCHLVRFIV